MGRGVRKGCSFSLKDRPFLRAVSWLKVRLLQVMRLRQDLAQNPGSRWVQQRVQGEVNAVSS